MGTIYETVVTCIGFILLIGAIIMLVIGYVAETGGLDSWNAPKPGPAEILDAEYSVIEYGVSLQDMKSVQNNAVQITIF